MRHDEGKKGLWTNSSDEEIWPCLSFFDTREEAMLDGRNEHDSPFYIGRIKDKLSPEFVASLVVEKGLDELDYTIENEEVFFSEDVDYCRQPTEDQLKELNSLVAGWFEKHKLLINYYAIEDIEQIDEI